MFYDIRVFHTKFNLLGITHLVTYHADVKHKVLLNMNGVEFPFNVVFLDNRVGSSLALHCFAPVLIFSCDKGLSRENPYYKLSEALKGSF